MKTVEILFWILILIVFYTYLGYGILIFVIVKLKGLIQNMRVSDCSEQILPEVTLLIAAYNEEDVVRQKMENTLNLNYPKDLLKVVWITDGSNDNTNVILSEYPDVIILHEALRKGKTSAINRAIQFIKSPIVVLSDSNTLLNKEAVVELVKPFSDKRVGCVAGEKRVSVLEKDNASSGGEGIYWKYESFLKIYDSRLYSVVGAAGELYAIRRELFEELSPDTLLDDFQISLSIAEKGYLVKYCRDAFATECGSLNIEEERKRKIRISAGGLQAIIRMPQLLNFSRHPLLTFQYISHRVLRWSITPVSFFLLLPLNIFLAVNTESLIFKSLLILQILFYLLAIIGGVCRNRRIETKILFIPYYFFFMNFSVFQGLIYLIGINKSKVGIWEKAKRKEN